MKPKEVEKSTTLKVGMKHGPSNFIKYHLPSTTTTTTISEENHHTEKNLFRWLKDCSTCHALNLYVCVVFFPPLLLATLNLIKNTCGTSMCWM